MLVSYFDWQKLEHYLDNFILIITALSLTFSNLKRNNNSYRLFKDCLRIFYQAPQDHMDTILSVFGIKIDINPLVPQILVDKI